MLEPMLESTVLTMLESMVLTHMLLDITDIPMLMPKLTQLSLLLPPLSHTLLSPTLSHMTPTEPMLGMDIHMPMDLDTPHMDTPALDMLDSDIMDLDITEDKNLPTSLICNLKELNPKSYFG